LGVAALPIIAWAHNRWVTVLPARPPRRRAALVALVALVAATAVWASTFLVTKQSLDAMAPAAFLTWRFGAAAVVLFLVSHRQVMALDTVERRRATLLGVLLGGGFLLQTTGLQTASAGLSGFLTGASVVLVPVVARLGFAEQEPGLGGSRWSWRASGWVCLPVGLRAGSRWGRA